MILFKVIMLARWLQREWWSLRASSRMSSLGGCLCTFRYVKFLLSLFQLLIECVDTPSSSLLRWTLSSSSCAQNREFPSRFSTPLDWPKISGSLTYTPYSTPLAPDSIPLDLGGFIASGNRTKQGRSWLDSTAAATTSILRLLIWRWGRFRRKSRSMERIVSGLVVSGIEFWGCINFWYVTRDMVGL